MCVYRVGVGVDLINELLHKSGGGEGGGTAWLIFDTFIGRKTGAIKKIQILSFLFKQIKF